MLIEQFNALILKYSQHLTALKLMRLELAKYKKETLFQELGKIDIDHKGYFTKQQLLHQFCQKSQVQSERRKAFLFKYFPTQKVSYSIILIFLSESIISNPNQQQQKAAIVPLMTQIFQHSLQNFEVQIQMMKNISSFISMKYHRPSKTELQQYVICQNLTVDIQEMAAALNLIQNHIDCKYTKNDKAEQTLSDPTIANLNNLMKRIQDRVGNFGKKWLLTHQA